ncbi:MAG: D-sedoheptulose 7-phosphate isomerase [Deltaproteobacteria bacterium]|nr:D-sedoheptulose 7-phosphate isomerase [Deltaproteobacteria bacterium]
MKEIIKKELADSLKVKETFIRENVENLILLAERIALAFTGDCKLLICGNGGSAADAQHIAAEFVNRYTFERPPLPAMALTTDTSVITSIGNDYSFDDIFSKQVKALGMEGDILLSISTSGNSKNVLSAARDARSQGMYTAGFIGYDGGKLAKMVDMALVVESNATPRIQEAHILAGHIICRLVDYIIFQRHLSEEQGK